MLAIKVVSFSFHFKNQATKTIFVTETLMSKTIWNKLYLNTLKHYTKYIKVTWFLLLHSSNCVYVFAYDVPNMCVLMPVVGR